MNPQNKYIPASKLIQYIMILLLLEISIWGYMVYFRYDRGFDSNDRHNDNALSHDEGKVEKTNLLSHDDRSIKKIKQRDNSTQMEETMDVTETEKVTVIIMTYQRIEIFQHNPTMEKIIPLECVYELLIIWNDVNNVTGIPLVKQTMIDHGIASKVRFHVPEKNSMNNRFMPLPGIKTNAIFYLDDEWTLSEDNFYAGFMWWKINPYRLVGFTPRLLSLTNKNQIDGFNHFNRKLRGGPLRGHGFNIMLPGAGMFMHRMYIDFYSSNDPGMIKARNMVEKSLNCDDILINFIIPNAYQPPLSIAINNERSYDSLRESDINKFNKRDDQRISKDWKKHTQLRQKCLRTFTGIFGWPLVTSTQVITTSPNNIFNPLLPSTIPLNRQSQQLWHKEKAIGDKLFFGCDFEKWNTFKRYEYYHLFMGLNTEYGWSILTTKSLTKEALTKYPPLVILFCNPVDMEKVPIDKLRQLNTRVALYVDDLQMFNQYEPNELSNYLTQTDILISPYAYRIPEYISKLSLDDKDIPYSVWIPHSASPEFIPMTFNENPSRTIFISNSNISSDYPLENWLIKEFQPNHRYLKYLLIRSNQLNDTTKYAETIRSYSTSITTSTFQRYLTAQVFEIPATGSLLLIDLDLKDILESLGFFHMKHYVGFDGSTSESIEKIISWVSNPANFDVIDEIRKQGMDLVRNLHQTKHRCKALDDIFVERQTIYDYEEINLRPSPCPLVGYADKQSCDKAYENQAQYYTPWNQISSSKRSFLKKRNRRKH